MGKLFRSKKEVESDPRSIRERAYDWLYDHHVTVKVMDYVIGILIALTIFLVIGGMIVGR